MTYFMLEEEGQISGVIFFLFLFVCVLVVKSYLFLFYTSWGSGICFGKY